MLDSTTKSIINNARNILVGKVPNPQSQVDLITIAMIYKFMDDMDKETIEFGGERSFFKDEKIEKNEKGEELTDEDNDKLGNLMSSYAWSELLKPSLGNEGRMELYSKALEKLQISKHIPELFRRIFKGAFLPFRDGATLTLFLKEIDKFSYDNSENLGNAFEFLLSIMGSQGDAGQFRTPRHIIDFMVDVVNPQKDDKILDPACGTAGFLISAYKHILKHNSKDFNEAEDIKLYAGKTADSAEEIEIEISKNLRGDLLNPKEKEDLTKNIVGYDISADMQKLALVNLYLHGFKTPDISEYDTLSDDKKWDDNFDVILANPPFMTPKGGIKPHKKFSISANRSEVLFVDYIIEHLTSKGKAGIIVPEGIVFQSATAYKSLRKKLIEEKYLYAVVSLPSGVFQPYSGVKTSILLIDRQIAKQTEEILFIDIKNDGFDLGAQRRAIQKNDLLEAFNAIREFQERHCEQNEAIQESMSKYKIANLVPKNQIAENGEYNLTGSRYIETVDYSKCKWDMVKLGEVCDVRDGTHDSPKAQHFGYPLITSKNLINGSIDFNNVNLISEEDHIKISKRSNVDDGDVLYAMIGTIGNPVVVKKDRDFSIKNVALFKVGKDNPKLNNHFLKYILEKVTEDFNNKAVGGTQKFVSLKFLREYEIPLPPLEVQEEIVKELDSYQQVIDGAKKVVENWKPTLPIKPSSKSKKMKDVCEINSNTFDPKMQYGEFCNYIDISSVENGTGVFTGANKLKCDEAPSRARREVLVNDVLISTVRPNLKAFTILEQVPENAVASTGFAVLRSKLDLVDSKYLFYSVFQDYLVEQMVSMSGKGAYPSINQKDVESLDIFLPSIEEQKEIVAKIEIEEQAIEQCKKLIKIHEEKIAEKIKSVWCEDDSE